MKKIEIAEDVLDLIPEEFKNLDDLDYKLTKIGSTRSSKIGVGHYNRGVVRIVSLSGLPAVSVTGYHFNDYLRTSPITGIIDSAQDEITFSTEGGVYKLEKAVGNE